MTTLVKVTQAEKGTVDTTFNQPDTTNTSDTVLVDKNKFEVVAVSLAEYSFSASTGLVQNNATEIATKTALVRFSKGMQAFENELANIHTRPQPENPAEFENQMTKRHDAIKLDIDTVMKLGSIEKDVLVSDILKYATPSYSTFHTTTDERGVRNDVVYDALKTIAFLNHVEVAYEILKDNKDADPRLVQTLERLGGSLKSYLIDAIGYNNGEVINQRLLNDYISASRKATDRLYIYAAEHKDQVQKL